MVVLFIYQWPSLSWRLKFLAKDSQCAEEQAQRINKKDYWDEHQKYYQWALCYNSLLI